MRAHNAPSFKETQLFDWESEPSVERGSTQFREDGAPDLPHPRVRPRSGGNRWLLVAAALAIAGGVALMSLIPRLLHGLHGLG